MSDLSLLASLVAVIVGTGGVSALFLLRPQRESIIAQASDQAVKTVRTAMEASQAVLREQLRANAAWIAELEAELKLAREDARMARRDLAAAEAELRVVKGRVIELERRLNGG